MHATPVRAQQSYRHEAFLWHEKADFTDGLVPFITDGLDAGEPVMVALVPEHTAWVEDALRERSGEVTFVDMAELGRNPARIIPAWQRFLDLHSDRRQPVRGIGEPIWPGRRREELLECQLHEALLNVAVDPEIPFWLICPYDTENLGPEVVEEASRSHPVLVEADSYQGSGNYGGRPHVDSLFSRELDEPTTVPIEIDFGPENLDGLEGRVAAELLLTGLAAESAEHLARATHRLAFCSLSRGAAHGRVRAWRQPHAAICEISDDTVVHDLLLGRRAPFGQEHDGLWQANQLCDLVQLRSTTSGTTVRVHTWL
jgi:hypothetical protein